ncbi:MAG TPA: formate dehydrogenase N subunit beta transmembrane domain-containing protein, partial [Magnetospirillaceae bacterium]|nr:formate dehydrogenase N subunit beta transmembrane domain-containing protein [Magnetospirillaceae bacterium]
THVMYVLHHADKPSLYAGLPDKPHISKLIGVWKNVLKPLALLGIAFAGIGSLVHAIVSGPDEIDVEDEVEARREMEHAETERRTQP